MASKVNPGLIWGPYWHYFQYKTPQHKKEKVHENANWKFISLERQYTASEQIFLLIREEMFI